MTASHEARGEASAEQIAHGKGEEENSSARCRFGVLGVHHSGDCAAHTVLRGLNEMERREREGSGEAPALQGEGEGKERAVAAEAPQLWRPPSHTAPASTVHPTHPRLIHPHLHIIQRSSTLPFLSSASSVVHLSWVYQVRQGGPSSKPMDENMARHPIPKRM